MAETTIRFPDLSREDLYIEGWLDCARMTSPLEIDPRIACYFFTDLNQDPQNGGKF